MSDISPVDSNSEISPTIPVNPATPTNNDLSKEVADSAQNITDSADKEHVFSPQAQKIIDTFMQGDVLSDPEIAKKEKSIPSVSSSSGSSNSTDDNATGESSSSSTTSTTGSTESTTSDDSSDGEEEEDSEHALTDKEQKFVDECLSSNALSDTQKQRIEEQPEDFMNLLVEPTAKNMKKNKEETQDRYDEIEQNIESGDPEKAADTTTTTKPDH